MAPPKVTKKPPKAIEKPITKPLVKAKNKKKKKNYTSFSSFLFKVLRNLTTEIGISRPSMDIMNSFVNDFLEQIAVEASRLVAHTKKSTLTSREISAALNLLIPGELAMHANSEASKALRKYYDSKKRDLQESA